MQFADSPELHVEMQKQELLKSWGTEPGPVASSCAFCSTFWDRNSYAPMAVREGEDVG